jgi:hypothetical protein
VLLLAVACQRKVTVSSPAPATASGTGVGVVGGATPAEAVGMMLAAAKAEDIQAVGSVWGDPDGLAREKWPRSEFEMRAFYIVKCLRNDRFQIMNEGAAANNRRVATVQISKGSTNLQTTFQMAQGKAGRWYVEKVDLDPMTRICQMA